MQPKANPTLIGLFVIVTLVLGVGALFILTNGGFSHQSTRFILFFEGDVKGLQVGSPVNFRGVNVGNVESMSITYLQQNNEFRIPVVIGIDDTRVSFDGVKISGGGLIRLDELIEQGLRARLNLQSLVTGKLEIELDFHPDSPARFVSADDNYPEIPTIQSSMERIASAIEVMPIERITQRLEEILNAIDQMVESGELSRLKTSLIQIVERLDAVTEQLMRDMPKLLDGSVSSLQDTQLMLREVSKAAVQSQNLIALTEGRLGQAFSRWDQTMASGDAAFSELKQVATSADKSISQDSPVMKEMTATLRELGTAARSIRIMSEYLERHPEALLRGKQ